MFKWLALATLAFIGTILLLAAVVLEDPPALLGYLFGFFNGAAWTGLIALKLIRENSHD